MADDNKYYAWTVMKVTGENGKVTTIKPGDEVTANSLGISREDFRAYLQSGAIRTTPHPDVPASYTGSPVEYRKEQIANATEQAIDDAWVNSYPVAATPDTELSAEEQAHAAEEAQQAQEDQNKANALGATL